MEHSCYKCGQMIEEGTAFCPLCGAPQIRVAIAAPVQPTPLHDDAYLPPERTSGPGSPGVALISTPHAVRPCALAAAIAVMLTLLGLNPFVTMAACGVLAVVFYRYRNPFAPMRAGAGARLGALSGLLGFAISAVLSAVVVTMFHKGAEVRDFMVKSIQENASRYPASEYQAALDFIRSPTGLAIMMLFVLFFGFVLFVVLSSLGGALTGAFFGRRNSH